MGWLNRLKLDEMLKNQGKRAIGRIFLRFFTFCLLA